tara:strand:+ start:1415 stop:1675 length:261 start_codon:yes stop_codon:yes gene_type:complete
MHLASEAGPGLGRRRLIEAQSVEGRSPVSVARATRRSGMINTHPKPLPPLTSDAEAEDFVKTADLSEYDLSGFTPMRFKIEPKPPC